MEAFIPGLSQGGNCWNIFKAYGNEFSGVVFL